MRSGRVRVLPHGMLDVLRHGNLGALLLPLVLLSAGWGARTLLARKTVVYNWKGITLSHPAGWTVAERSLDPTEGESVVLVDLLGPGRIKPRVTLRIAPLPPEVPPPTGQGETGETRETGETPPVASAIAETLSNRLPLYYPMSSQQVQLGGAPATRVDSAFVFTPRAVPRRKADIPVVMRAIDLIVLRTNDALSIQVAAAIEDFEAQRSTLEAMVSSLGIDAAARPGDQPHPAEPAPAPEPVAEAEAEAEAETIATGGVSVAGQIVDADSGLAVPGAIVLFLAPGTNVDDLTDDNLTEIAYTTGLSDSSGHFASNRPLKRSAHYAVLVVADGYHWIGSDDGVTIGGATTSHLDVGEVRLRRR